MTGHLLACCRVLCFRVSAATTTTSLISLSVLSYQRASRYRVVRQLGRLCSVDCRGDVCGVARSTGGQDPPRRVRLRLKNEIEPPHRVRKDSNTTSLHGKRTIRWTGKHAESNPSEKSKVENRFSYSHLESNYVYTTN